MFIPEGLFPVSGTRPVTTNGGPTADYVSLKNVQTCYAVVHLAQTVGHATAITVERATDVAGTGHVAIATNVPIWYGNVSTTSNALTRQADGVSYTLGVGVTGDVYIIFQIDPASLGADFDCITVVSANSGQATNFIEVTYWMLPRYAGKTASQPSYIVD
jgi:hypothetical protein